MSNAENIIPQWTQADRFTKARHVAGLSQEDLAERLDLSLRTIRRYEAGMNPKRTIIVSWALACGVSVRWLAFGEEVPTDTEGVTLWEPDEYSQGQLQFAA